MLVSDFHFHLPDELIASYPAAERDSSRLMLLDRFSGEISESPFSAIADYLRPGDLLVMNNTRVIPARLFGRKETGGRVELFLVGDQRGRGQGTRVKGEIWSCLLNSSKPCRVGQVIQLSDGVAATLLERIESDDSSPPIWIVEFSGADNFGAWLERAGEVPIPPYLGREPEKLDNERYQTVYAEVPGAVAAPTAGLHFTGRLLESLQQKGVRLATVTLHVGPGTFQPVRARLVQDHRIHKERFQITAETVRAVEETKISGGRVVAVGTTAARTLEYAASKECGLKAMEGEADIFIYPGYRFKVVDALLTNFHLPESTLLMLVSAFAGQEFVMKAYKEAISSQFRFYSYGDAMLIV